MYKNKGYKIIQNKDSQVLLTSNTFHFIRYTVLSSNFSGKAKQTMLFPKLKKKKKVYLRK